MSELRRLQRRFAAVLLDGADREELCAAVRGDARADAATRVAIYADMYRLRLCEVLEEVFPLTRRLLGDVRFAAQAEAYIVAHPSRSPSLRPFGHIFADALATRAELPPRASSLARLEWARYDVFDAVDEPPLTRDRLASLDPDAMAFVPLRAIRASRVLELPAGVDALYRALAKEEAAVESAPTPERILVWREGTTVFHRVLGDREAPFVARLSAGVTVGEVCEALAADQPVDRAAAEAFSLIGRWIADGLLVDPSS